MRVDNYTIIAIDLGTATTAIAIRLIGQDKVQTFSPITLKEEPQKTPSDLHVFLDSMDEPITIKNSQLGNSIGAGFKKKQYHFHFQAYKMALYNAYIENDDSHLTSQTIQYPQMPLVKPLCGSKEFQLSEIYKIVIRHIKVAILEWFAKNGQKFDLQNIIWVITVPAIAGHKQKEFMKKVFVDGIGKIRKQYIKDCNLFCVLEPEGAFLYAQYTNLVKINDGLKYNVVVIDVGGGTLNTSVTTFQNGEDPEVKKNNFGCCVGGADVEKAFLRDIEEITQFKKYSQQKKYSQATQQTILSHILNQFQTQKHFWFGCDQKQVHGKDFLIAIDSMILYPEQINEIRQTLSSGEWGGQEQFQDDEQDILFRDDGDGQYSLFFKVSFVIGRYVNPIADIISRKIKQLINEAIADGFKINMGFIVGGFSFCKSLKEKVLSDFAPEGFEILSFPTNSSLAIVIGATVYSCFNMKKKIPQHIGLEVNWPYYSCYNQDHVDQQLIIDQDAPDLQFVLKYMPEFCFEATETTPVGLKYLFRQDQQVDTNQNYIEVEYQFQANKFLNYIEFRLHYMPEKLLNTPKNFADTDLYCDKQPIKSIEQRGFSVKIPQEVMKMEADQRTVTVKFRYEIISNQVSCLLKWAGKKEFSDFAEVSNVERIPLEYRYSQNPTFWGDLIPYNIIQPIKDNDQDCFDDE